MTIRKGGFRALAAQREYARRYPVHTVVYHTDPDLEIAMGHYLLSAIEGVRERLGIRKDFRVKFVHSGSLRAEDWRELGLGGGQLTAAEIGKRGYLFFDCGGGRFDSHGKGIDNSSLDLLVDVCHKAIENEKPQMLRVIEIVSENDRTGADIAPDGGTNARTPHTRRHLRKLVDGLNLRYPRDPEKVIAYMNFAFCAIEHLATDAKMAVMGLGPILNWIDRNSDGGATSAATLERCLDHAGSVFWVDLIIEEMRNWGVPVECLIEEYEAALGAEELEWTRAEADFNDLEKTKVFRIQGSFPLRAKVAQEVTVTVGHSASPRFGEVARSKAKAEIVIQTYPDGKFLVCTKSLLLDKVAAAVRAIDLDRRGVPAEQIKAAALDKVGHCALKTASGRPVETLYFPEYRKAFGNAFRSNPLSPDCAVSEEEVVEAIRGSFPCQDPVPDMTPVRQNDRGHSCGNRGGNRRR